MALFDIVNYFLLTVIGNLDVKDIGFIALMSGFSFIERRTYVAAIILEIEVSTPPIDDRKLDIILCGGDPIVSWCSVGIKLFPLWKSILGCFSLPLDNRQWPEPTQ